MTKSAWTAFKDEQPPEGYGPIYVTNGSSISFVQRQKQADTEVERWVLAEPEAVPFRLNPSVANPTHWAVMLPGLPNVKAEDVPEISNGGPPSKIDPDEEIKVAPVQESTADVQKVQIVRDPLDHDADGKRGGSLPRAK